MCVNLNSENSALLLNSFCRICSNKRYTLSNFVGFSLQNQKSPFPQKQAHFSLSETAHFAESLWSFSLFFLLCRPAVKGLHRLPDVPAVLFLFRLAGLVRRAGGGLFPHHRINDGHDRNAYDHSQDAEPVPPPTVMANSTQIAGSPTEVPTTRG